MNPILAIGQIIAEHRADRVDPDAGSRHRPVRDVRRRLGRLPQPPRRRAPALAVHRAAAGAVRPVLRWCRSHSSADRDRGRRAAPQRTRTHDPRDGALVARAGARSSSSSAVRSRSRRRRVRRPADPVEPTPEITLPPPVTYREGVVGSPASVTPVTARTRADRTLVGLIFSGLVRPARPGAYEPDLAESWTTDATGTTWTVHAPAGRDVARRRAGDGRRRGLHRRGAQEPGQRRRHVRIVGRGHRRGGRRADRAVHAGRRRSPGFLAVLCQPLLPAHLLADVPSRGPRRRATSPASRSGRGRSASWSWTRRTPCWWRHRPVATPVDPTPGPSLDSLASPYPAPTAAARSRTRTDRGPLLRHGGGDGRRPAERPDRRRGGVHAVRDGRASRGRTGSSACGTPRRPCRRCCSTCGRPIRSSADAAVRRALLAAIDRDALVAGPLAGDAVRADALVPPSSWAFDATAAAPLVAYDPAGGRQGPHGRGLEEGRRGVGGAEGEDALRAGGAHGAGEREPAPRRRGRVRARRLGAAWASR